MNYQEERQRFYQNIDGFWADVYDEEYALYDVHTVRKEEIEAMRKATERIGHIFYKTSELLRLVPDETLLEMGYPPETLAFIRMLPPKGLKESVIARLDLVPYGTSYKCFEINADTPMFIKEVFSVNEAVCNAHSKTHPNQGMEQHLFETIRQSIKQVTHHKKNPHIVFTAHGENMEDARTVAYLMEAVPSATFTPLHLLKIQKGVGLFDEHDRKIDVLYRQTFPIEGLLQDKDEQGNPIGVWLLELVMRGELALLNPPSAFLTQNKAVQAVIWGMYEERNAYFTEEELAWIGEYFIPTYMNAGPFIENQVSFVKKPTFGREGDTVSIYDEWGSLVTKDIQTSYTQHLPIYQQYIEQPSVAFKSMKGEQVGKILYGSFLVDGKASGIACRIGGMITNNLSYFLPLAME